MTHYGSLPTPDMTMSSSSSYSSSNRSRDDEALSENTPLLLSSNRFHPPLHLQEDLANIRDIVGEGGEQNGLLPLLSRIGVAPLGIEDEAIPPISCSPDENGETTLPRDDTLRCNADPMNGEDEGVGELGFRGGISKRQFWVVFTGRFPECSRYQEADGIC